MQVQRPQEAYLDSKIVFACVRKIKEDAEERRGIRSIFKTTEFAGLLKSSKYEDSGNIDWTRIGMDYYFSTAWSLFVHFLTILYYVYLQVSHFCIKCMIYERA